IFHIFFNMYFLYIFGRAVEDVLGSLRYLVLYFVSGISAALFHVTFSFLGGLSSYAIPAVGASGAISGVLGAYLILYPGTSLTACWIFFVFPACFSMRASLYLIFWFVTQVVYGYARIAGSVAVFAHVGGFLAGIAILSAVVDRSRLKELRFIEYIRSLPYLIFTYPKARGLSKTSKAVLSLVIASIIVGGFFILTATPEVGSVKVMNVQYTYDGIPYRDYAVVQLPNIQNYIAETPLDTTRILLSRLNAVNLVYNEDAQNKNVVVENQRYMISLRVGSLRRNVSLLIKYFNGYYDSEGFLSHGYGEIVTQVLVIQGTQVSIIDNVAYQFTISSKTTDLSRVTQNVGLSSIIVASAALFVVLSKDKELALVGE
ncbi:MAG: rhomboid family intramembrane serine protease, partial [Thermoprotei archaeon]